MPGKNEITFRYETFGPGMPIKTRTPEETDVSFMYESFGTGREVPIPGKNEMSFML
jgi:hypothetical protein